MAENFSYSKLNTYENCGFKYKLVYVDKHFIYDETVATEYGTLIHKTEESIAHSIVDGTPIDYDALKKSFLETAAKIERKYPKEYNEVNPKSGRTYKQKTEQYVASGIYRLEKLMKAHPSYKIVGIEKKFNFTDDKERTFKGAIDRVIFDSLTNKYIIQDIKSYDVELEHADLVTPLQFVIYILAATKMYDTTEENFICQYDLPLCDTTQDAGTKGFMNRGRKKLDSLFEKIGNKDFKPKPTPLCYWCQFSYTNPHLKEEGKNLCPYYSRWTREKPSFDVENQWMGEENHERILEAFKKLKSEEIKSEEIVVVPVEKPKDVRVMRIYRK